MSGGCNGWSNHRAARGRRERSEGRHLSERGSGADTHAAGISRNARVAAHRPVRRRTPRIAADTRHDEITQRVRGGDLAARTVCGQGMKSFGADLKCVSGFCDPAMNSIARSHDAHRQAGFAQMMERIGRSLRFVAAWRVTAANTRSSASRVWTNTLCMAFAQLTYRESLPMPTRPATGTSTVSSHRA